MKNKIKTLSIIMSVLISTSLLILTLYPNLKTVVQDTYFKYNIVPIYIITKEEDNNYPGTIIYEILVPGLTKDDVSIEIVHDEEIVIKYNQDKLNKVGFNHQLTTIPISKVVAKKGITAKLSDGVLTILIPKKTEQRIQIPVQ